MIIFRRVLASLIVPVALLVGSGGCMADAATPTTVKIPLRLTAGQYQLRVRGSIFAPDGRLLLSLTWRNGRGSTFVEIDPRTGETQSSLKLGVVEQALTVGPDGNVWFAGVRTADSRLVLGYIDAPARPHIFVLPPDLAHISGLAAGPDGAVWFTAVSKNGGQYLGRITTAGVLKMKFVANVDGPSWTAPLEPDPNGGLFSSFGAAVDNLAQISTKFSVKAVSSFLSPYVSDMAHNIWGFTYVSNEVVRIAPTGRRTLLPWTVPPGPGGQIEHGTMVLAADANLWFTGAVLKTVGAPGNYHSYFSTTLLGEATDRNTMQTWPAPFVDALKGPVGSTNYDQLLAGPDGRLYAIGYDTPSNLATSTSPLGHWHLFAVTLPDHPKVKPAAVHVADVAISHATARLRLTCTGQSGRYCDGTIFLLAGSRVLAKQQYALAAGLAATHSLAVRDTPRPQAIRVTSLAASSRTVENVGDH